MGAAFRKQQVLVIDLAPPFGWPGIPPFYTLFGRAIAWLVSSNSPATVSTSRDSDPFVGFEWVDDYIMVKLDVGNRLEYAEATLRTSLLTILGPESINESKFSSCSCEVHALSLDWNKSELTVSMPTAKIKKSLNSSRRSAWHQSCFEVLSA